VQTVVTKTSSTLAYSELPAMFRAADASSQKGQRRFIGEGLFSILFLFLAAVAGLFTYKQELGSIMADWAGIAAAFAFFLSLILQLDRLLFRPEQRWYDGRALAESTKTLAWRYSVGGNPFRTDINEKKKADAVFIERLQEMLGKLEESDANLIDPEDGEQITKAMQDLRSKPLPIRREAYKLGRIEDQRKWYHSKAAWNQKRAYQWNSMLIFVEVIGFVVALLKIVGVLPWDLLGVVGTLAVAVTFWLQLKQHQTLARSYAVAAMELGTIKSNIDDQETEEDWARFVDDAEEAISREHTLWLASHTLSLKHP
jgi:hypothetical protein